MSEELAQQILEKLASEKAAAEKWELSEREKEIIKNLGGKKTNESAR